MELERILFPGQLAPTRGESTQAQLVGCMAHARRKFIEAQKAQPKGKTGKAD